MKVKISPTQQHQRAKKDREELREEQGRAKAPDPTSSHLLAPLGWRCHAHCGAASTCGTGAASSIHPLEPFWEQAKPYAAVLGKPSEATRVPLTLLLVFAGKPEVLVRALQKAFQAPRIIVQGSIAKVRIPLEW